MSYKRKLKSLGKNWDNTRGEFGDSTGGFETVPSGNYVIGKLHCELEEDGDGNPRIKREQIILEGDHADFKVTDRMNIVESVAPRGMEFLLKWLNLLGYEVKSLDEDLEETLDAINENADATYQATIKEKDGFNNVFYNKVLEEGNTEPGGSDESGESERGEMPDIDDMTMRKLKKLIKDEELDVEVTDDMAEDDIRDEIEKAWDKPKSSDEPASEPATTSRRASRRSKSGGDDDKLRKALFTLGDAFGIDVDKDDDLAKLKKTLGDFTFKKKELEAKEVKVLEDADLGDIIK